MFGRILGHISKRTLQISGIVVLTILVVFFAATRSQVGRDELKRQIENSFNTAFEGHLSIDRLTGNLLYTLYAEHVQLTAPNGELIATIDSVVIEPRWQDLLQRTFSVKSISLHHPVLELSGDDHGQLNLKQALHPRARDSVSIGSDWTFKSATLHIENGHLLTRNSVRPNSTCPSGRTWPVTGSGAESEVSIGSKSPSAHPESMT